MYQTLKMHDFSRQESPYCMKELRIALTLQMALGMMKQTLASELYIR